MEIVVAKYNEDISWINNIKCKKTIYNKGSQNVPNSIKLPNIGREGHTYFHHIVENYDNLDEWTLFTQANPFDHVKNIESIINDFPISLDGEAKINVDNGAYFFSNGHFSVPVISESDGRPYHRPELDIDGLYRSIFDKRPPHQYVFTAGCIFLASKEIILKNNKEIYQKCLEISGTRRNAPWEFERMMQYIFK
jgi:hypothetical protein